MAPSEGNLNQHKHIKHENGNEEIEIKLDVFALVDFENDVLKARKEVIEKLEEQVEVEQVKTVYINKSDTYFDKDDLRWNTIEIVLTTKKPESLWNDKKFKHSLFSKCYIWQTVETNLGEHNREYFNKQKEEIRNAELRTRGYVL